MKLRIIRAVASLLITSPMFILNAHAENISTGFAEIKRLTSWPNGSIIVELKDKSFPTNNICSRTDVGIIPKGDLSNPNEGLDAHFTLLSIGHALSSQVNIVYKAECVSGAPVIIAVHLYD